VVILGPRPGELDALDLAAVEQLHPDPTSQSRLRGIHELINKLFVLYESAFTGKAKVEAPGLDEEFLTLRFFDCWAAQGVRRVAQAGEEAEDGGAHGAGGAGGAGVGGAGGAAEGGHDKPPNFHPKGSSERPASLEYPCLKLVKWSRVWAEEVVSRMIDMREITEVKSHNLRGDKYIGKKPGCITLERKHGKEAYNLYMHIFFGQEDPLVKKHYWQVFNSLLETLIRIQKGTEWYLEALSLNRFLNPQWQKEETNCAICSAKFARLSLPIVRPHHCRRCGWAVCDNCSTKRRTLVKTSSDPNLYTDLARAEAAAEDRRSVRVCDMCDERLQQQEEKRERELEAGLARA